MGELHAGATPRELVPGDPDAIDSLAARLGALAGGLGQAAAQIRLVEAGDWVGPAADAFDDVIDLEPARYETAASAFMVVGGALRGFAGVLRGAQHLAQVAIDTFAEAAVATDRWTGARRRYDATMRSADRGDASAIDVLDGLVPPPPGDPGAAGRSRAEALLEEARELVRQAGSQAAGVADDACDAAPDAPSLVERGLDWAGHAAREFLGGAWEASYDLGEFVWSMSTLHFVLDPGGWRRDVDELAAAIVYGIEHPAALARAFSDWDTWAESPFRAMGHLVPDAILAVTTAGTGTTGTAVRRVATVVAAATRLEDEAAESSARLGAAVDRSVDIFAITPEPVWRVSDETLYRADNRSPETIFAEGFAPRDPGNMDLAWYVTANVPSGFVSTTRDSGLIHTEPRHFQYEIDVPGGIDVNATLGPHDHAYEQEIAFPGGIESCYIEGARPYDDTIGTLGPFVPNPDYDPACDG
ncbi:MAG: scabin-related ADP-ribosyltransferase [Acidimicrobiales bacterium]